MTTRPDLLVLVAGTGTEVGKTWATCALARDLVARGIAVAARKPAQSYEPGEGPTDADLLGAATGERAETVCPRARWYEVPMAPPMAAAALDRPVPTVADLVAGIPFPTGTAVGLVESAGGLRSPIADDGDTVDLARVLQPDLVVLVADAGLGTINSVRMSAAALAGLALVVLLNRFDLGVDLHVRNRSWLAERDGFDVVTGSADIADRVEREWRAKLVP